MTDFGFRIPIQRENGLDPRTGLPWEWDSVLFERFGLGLVVCQECRWVGPEEAAEIHAGMHCPATVDLDPEKAFDRAAAHVAWLRDED